MDASHRSDLTRRLVLRGATLGTVTVPVLAACGDDPEAAPSASATSEQPTSTPTRQPSATDSPTPGTGGEVLAETGDIEVGGAVFLDSGIVITQEPAGAFHAFDRTCTHAGCDVTDVQDGAIHCPCHGSQFDVTSGAVLQGPAETPVGSYPVRLEGADLQIRR